MTLHKRGGPYLNLLIPRHGLCPPSSIPAIIKPGVAAPNLLPSYALKGHCCLSPFPKVEAKVEACAFQVLAQDHFSFFFPDVKKSPPPLETSKAEEKLSDMTWASATEKQLFSPLAREKRSHRGATASNTLFPSSFFFFFLPSPPPGTHSASLSSKWKRRRKRRRNPRCEGGGELGCCAKVLSRVG